MGRNLKEVRKGAPNGVHYLICKAEVETQIERTNIWMLRGRGSGRKWEIGIVHMYTIDTLYKIDK